MFANDNNGKYPMALSTNAGGSMEYNETGQVFRHFQAFSNQLCSPKLLACPFDRGRSKSTNWTTGFNNLNLSYFVGLDAFEENPQMILSGDRNISGGMLTNGNIMLFTANSPAGWTKDIHRYAGNILFADGSAHQVVSTNLRKQLQWISNNVCRLAIP